MNSPVLVTGGTGMIGRHLVKRLVAEGRRVYVTGREDTPPGALFLARDFHELSAGDVSVFATIWHLAAETDTRAADDTQWTVNYDRAAHFLDRCRRSGASKKLIYASSCAVYGRCPAPYGEERPCEPLNAYGAAKLALDKYASGFAVGIRPSNVFGPGEEHKGASASYLSTMVAKTRRARSFDLFACSRDLIAVDDMADAFLWAERFPTGVYNAGSGAAVDYFAAALEIAKRLDSLIGIHRVACPFPFEFQEYTRCNTAKIAAACRESGRTWNPKPWWAALADYMAGGWPLEPETVEVI